MDVGLDLPAGGNCQHALHRGKCSWCSRLVFSKYYYFSFNTCVVPPALCDLRLVLPRHFSSRTFQSPLFLIPIFISLSLSCQPMAANAVRHSQLFVEHCPVWERENEPSLYSFITLFSLPSSIPKSSLGNVFNVK